MQGWIIMQSSKRTKTEKNNEEIENNVTINHLPREIKNSFYTHLPLKTLGMFACTSQMNLIDKDILFAQLLFLVAHAIPVEKIEIITKEQERSEQRRWMSYEIDEWILKNAHIRKTLTKQPAQEKFILKAEKLLRSHPGFLFRKGIVMDPAGRKIMCSPYQLAWGMGDVWALKMMNNLIPVIHDGDIIAMAQYKEQFPEGVDERNKKLIDQIKIALQEVASAISEDPCSEGADPTTDNMELKATLDKTKIALKKLKSHLNPNTEEVVHSGVYFPVEILLMAHKELCHSSARWTRDQLSFYCCHVIGYIESLASAIDAQRFKHGLQHYTNETVPPTRTNNYFSLSLESFAELKLGVDFFVYAFSGALNKRVPTPMLFNGGVFVCKLIEKYIVQKNTALDELKPRLLCQNKPF